MREYKVMLPVSVSAENSQEAAVEALRVIKDMIATRAWMMVSPKDKPAHVEAVEVTPPIDLFMEPMVRYYSARNGLYITRTGGNKVEVASQGSTTGWWGTIEGDFLLFMGDSESRTDISDIIKVEEEQHVSKP
jgi:hypothetical protein